MGKATITNSKIYAKSNKNCICGDDFEDNTQTLTINGETLLRNVEDTQNNNATISWSSSGQLTINEGVKIEGMTGINIRKSADVSIKGASILSKNDCLSIKGAKGAGGSLELRNVNALAEVGGNALFCERDFNVSIYDSNLEVASEDTRCVKVMTLCDLRIERSTLKANHSALLIKGQGGIGTATIKDSKLLSRTACGLDGIIYGDGSRL